MCKEIHTVGVYKNIYDDKGYRAVEVCPTGRWKLSSINNNPLELYIECKKSFFTNEWVSEYNIFYVEKKEYINECSAQRDEN